MFKLAFLFTILMLFVALLCVSFGDRIAPEMLFAFLAALTVTFGVIAWSTRRKRG